MSSSYGQNTSTVPSIAYYSSIGDALANDILALKGQGYLSAGTAQETLTYPNANVNSSYPLLGSSPSSGISMFGSSSLNMTKILEYGGAVLLLVFLFMFLGGKK